jgi:hypothetical protein
LTRYIVDLPQQARASKKTQGRVNEEGSAFVVGGCVETTRRAVRSIPGSRLTLGTLMLAVVVVDPDHTALQRWLFWWLRAGGEAGA